MKEQGRHGDPAAAGGGVCAGGFGRLSPVRVREVEEDDDTARPVPTWATKLPQRTLIAALVSLQKEALRDKSVFGEQCNAVWSRRVDCCEGYDIPIGTGPRGHLSFELDKENLSVAQEYQTQVGKCVKCGATGVDISLVVAEARPLLFVSFKRDSKKTPVLTDSTVSVREVSGSRKGYLLVGVMNALKDGYQTISCRGGSKWWGFGPTDKCEMRAKGPSDRENTKVVMALYARQEEALARASHP